MVNFDVVLHFPGRYIRSEMRPESSDQALKGKPRDGGDYSQRQVMRDPEHTLFDEHAGHRLSGIGEQAAEYNYPRWFFVV